MLRLESTAATLVLASVVALGPLATDMYLPALPNIADALQANTDQVQLTLSIYLVGFAIAQLICGPLADRFGRRPILIIGLLLFAGASLGCATADSIQELTVLRFLQALGGAAGPVLGRAAVRDIHGPLEAARILAFLATAMALAPAVAPTIGGFLIAGFGWPAVFVALAVYACAAAVLFAWALPEPLHPDHRQSIKPMHLLRNYRQLLLHRRYIGYTLTNACIFSGLFAFLSGASFVLIDFLGIPAEHFGLYFAAMVCGYVMGSLFAGHTTRRLGIDPLIVIGGSIAVAGGTIMTVLAQQEVYSVWAVVLPQAVFACGLGIVLPQTMAGALAPFPHMAGSASALFGFIQMTLAAGVGVAVGHLHQGTPLVMAATIAGMAVAAMAVFFAIVRTEKAAEEEGQAGESVS